MWWQHAVYGGALLISLFCMGLIDYRQRYALFYEWRRTLKTIIPAILIFVLWDIVGIINGIFSDGDGQYRSGIQLGPHFPIEEILFLMLLTYTSLILWCAVSRAREGKDV